MAKFLKDVLKGNKLTITKKATDLGGYAPKAGDEQKFAKIHVVDVTTVNGTDDQFKGGTKKASFKRASEGGVTEAKETDTPKCNNTASGVACPVHGIKECTSGYMKEEKLDELSKKTMGGYVHAATRDALSRQYALGKGDKSDTRKLMNRRKGIDKAVDKLTKEEADQIDELSTDLLHRAAHKAAKVAMTDVQGRSGPIFKKRAAQANKFRAKGMEQEKKEKAVKAVKEETIDEVLTKSTSAGETISDFVHSDNPKFAGKSKEKRKEMALAAYYAKQREQKEEVEQIDEVVVKKSMSPQDKKALQAYTAQHRAKLAAHDTGIGPIKKSFKDFNNDQGTHKHEPSKMGIRHVIGSGYYKNEEVEVTEAMTPKQKAHSHRTKTAPGPKGFTHDPSSNFEAPVHKVEVSASKEGNYHSIMHHIRSKDKHSAVFDAQLHFHKRGYKIHNAVHKGIVKESDTPITFPNKTSDNALGQNI